MRQRITVIGDLMIDVDHFVEAADEKEGRERLIIRESKRRLGTAGAVAQMVAALGCDVTLIAVVGEDDRDWVKRQLPGCTHLMNYLGFTTRRERFYYPDWTVAGPRLDFNRPKELIDDRDQRAFANRALGSAADAFIVCDHARGVVGKPLMEELRKALKPIFVDPHPLSDFSAFGGVDTLAMNREEGLAAVKAKPDPENIISKRDADGLVWYRGGWLFAEDPKPGEFDTHKLYFPSMAGEIVDTLGAGDQFIAALAVARVRGHKMEESILFANAAAGMQCERRGIVPVTWLEVAARLKPDDDEIPGRASSPQGGD